MRAVVLFVNKHGTDVAFLLQHCTTFVSKRLKMKLKRGEMVSSRHTVTSLVLRQFRQVTVSALFNRQRLTLISNQIFHPLYDFCLHVWITIHFKRYWQWSAYTGKRPTLVRDQNKALYLAFISTVWTSSTCPPILNIHTPIYTTFPVFSYILCSQDLCF